MQYYLCCATATYLLQTLVQWNWILMMKNSKEAFQHLIEHLLITSMIRWLIHRFFLCKLVYLTIEYDFFQTVSESYYVHKLMANKIYLDNYTNRMQILNTEKLCEFVYSSPSLLTKLFEAFSGSIEFRYKYSVLTKKYEETREDILKTNREMKNKRLSVQNLESFITLQQNLVRALSVLNVNSF